MRILKITFKNINSFRGEHEIDFTQKPLSETGIFAIIGPTGSGKSTILDALTLALFNQIPRFDKRISRTDVDQSGSVLTHFTDEGYATIEYTSKNQKYRSRWSISRAKTGNLRDYEMELSFADSGEIIESQKGNIPSLNEKIIGLSYDQFVKSILLSQGEFSKFIKAGKNERAKLLEDITGTHIYSKIGAAVYAKSKEVKTALQLERTKLEGIFLLSEEEQEQIHNSIKEQDVYLKENGQTIQSLSQQIALKSEYTSLIKLLEVSNSEIENLNLELKRFAKDAKRMESHERLIPLRGEIIKLQGIHVTLNQKEDELKDHLRKKQEADALLNSSMDSMSKLIGDRVSTKDFMSKMSQFEKKVLKLDDSLSNLEKKGAETRERIVRISNTSKLEIATQLGNPRIDPTEALSIIDRRTQATKSNLKYNNQQELVAQQATTIKRIGLFENAAHLRLQFDVTHKKIKEVEVFLHKTEETVTEHKKAIAEQSVAIDKIKSEISVKRKEKERAHVRLKLEDHRKQLAENEPCPLCGSLDHPYAVHALADIGVQDVALRAKEQQLEQLIQDFNKSNNIISAGEEALRLRKKEHKALLAESNNHLKSLKTTIQALGFDKDPGKAFLEKEMKTLVSERALIENELLKQEEIKYLEQIKPEFTQIQQVLSDYQRIKSARNALYAGEDVTDEVNAIQNKFAKSIQAVNTAETLINSVKKEIKGYSETKKIETDKLLPKLKKLGYPDIEAVQMDFLAEAEYLEIKNKKEQLAAEEVKLTSELKRIQSEIAKLDKDNISETNILDLQKSLREAEQKRDKANEEKGALQNKLSQNQENINRHSQLVKQIKSKEEDAEKWFILDQYIGDATGSKFSNFAQDLTLSNLIALANSRLKKLSDRYILTKPEDESDMRVIDTYQGNSSRIIKTLSGGETFLISLSLALSLSDLASKNVRLDSLFIDEGFGTLDQETLDIALSTLESLQSESNKTIGVISHVEALKDRIHTQIQLTKNAQGFSTISITNTLD